MNNGTAHITCCLNPVSRRTVSCVIPAGKRLSELFDLDGIRTEINGIPVSDDLIRDGDMITIVVPPQGSNQGKDVARTSLVIAAMVGATALAGPLGMTTASGALTMGGRLFVAAASLGATIGANALIPPIQEKARSAQQENFTRLGALTGSRNQILPYGTVPRVYGHRKIYPPMSARPFTYILANEQYLNLLFCLGPGPLELSNPKIGDTLIGTFDSNNKFTSNDNFEDIRIEVAEQPDLYANSVSEEVVGVALNELNDQAIRTTDADIDRFSVDIVFPQGLFGLNENNRTTEAVVDFKIEMRETGTTEWDLVDNGNFPLYIFGSSFSRFPMVSPGVYRANHSARETLRVGMNLEVENGQYDIRITRLTAEGDGGSESAVNVFDAAEWTVLRSTKFQYPTDLPGAVQLAMRVKATDQLTGVLDNFSVEAKARLAYYDGAVWQETTFDPDTGNGTGGLLTSNPAWIMADILTGPQNARAISKTRLDEDSFKDFADNCATNGRQCNIVLDSQRTVFQTLRLVGSAGRGTISIQDGSYAIVQDEEQVTPVQHFTPRNSWGFNSTRVFPDVPHAIRVRFTNPDANWETDEAIVYDDGYSEDGTACQFDDGTGVCKTATKFEVLDLDGVTSWDQAWKEGRYRLAEARLRPERYTLNVDVENIVCHRGDLVFVSHDVTLWGLGWGRIKSVTRNGLNEVTSVTLDEEVDMAGGSYNIRIRTQTGSSVVLAVDSGTGSFKTLNITTPEDVAILKGDMFMFGEVGTETQALKVFAIEPQGDLSARLTLIDTAPEIYDADTGTIPEFNSNITEPVDLDAPPPIPTITDIRSNGLSLYKDSDSNPVLRIVVSYTVGGGTSTELVEGRFRVQDDTDGWTSFGQSEASSGSLSLKDVERGSTYIIQIRARRGDQTSRWVQAAAHTVGEDISLIGRPENAIGYITEALDGAYTEIPVNLSVPARQGIDYFIIDELERELISITPTTTGGPGEVTLAIEEQVIEAPKNSYIVKAPAQEEAENTIVPGFEFVGETLEVIGNELQATMDLISQGATWAKVNADNVNLDTGRVLLEGVEGDLDHIVDGTTYARVAAISITPAGLVLVEGLSGDLDDLADGANFQKVQSANLTAGGLVLLSASVGDIDDISDGTDFAKVKRAALDASGLVLLAGTVGDMDDITDGTTYSKVKATNVAAGNIRIIGPDGQTVIDQGQLFTDAVFASEATITKRLTMGTGSEIVSEDLIWSIDKNFIKHPSLGGSIVTRELNAAFDVSSTSVSGFSQEWGVRASAAGTGDDDQIRTIKIVRWTKPFGMNSITISGKGRRDETIGTGLWSRTSNVTGEIKGEAGTSDTQGFSGGANQDFQLRLNVSSLTAGQEYTIQVKIQARVTGDASNDIGDSAELTTYLREELDIRDSTEAA